MSREEHEQLKRIVQMYKEMSPEDRKNYLFFGMGMTATTPKGA